MIKTPEQLAELNRGTVEAAMALAKVSMDSMEKMARLQMEAARTVLEESIGQSKQLAEVKDPQALMAMRAAALEQGMEQMAAYSRSVYDLAAKTQADVGKIIEQGFTAFNRELAQMVDEAAKSAPAGSEPAMAMVKQMMATNKQMVEAMNKVAKQVTETADANVKAAAESAIKAAKAGGKK